MSTELTAAAQLKADAPIQQPQVVLQIDGIDKLFGIGEIKKYIRIGDDDLVLDGTWKIGGLRGFSEQLDIIDLDGSSNSISQQIMPEKGGATSVSSIQISLIDKNEFVTQMITPGEMVDDILGRKAWVYLGYQNTAFPQDFVRIFAGIIDEVASGPTVVINVAHPEQKKRVEIFQKITTALTQPAYYRSRRLQHVLYQTRRDVVGTVTVAYTGGGTAGSEVVSVAGNNISIQIQAGVSTATDIRNAIETNLPALSLVDIEVDSDYGDELQTTMSATALGSDTTLHVESTKGMLLPVPSEGFTTFVRINDEVIQYTGLTDTTITGCTRGFFAAVDDRSAGASHEEEDSVETWYRLEGQALDIALKLLMSGGDPYFATGIKVKSIVDVENVGAIPNAMWFENINIQDAWGVTVGDKVTTTGDAIPGNNVTDALISEIVATPYGSYIVLSGVSLTAQPTSTALASFGSKWNVYPEGAGCMLGGDEVDVPEFERIRETYAASIFTYDYYIKDTITAKDFIDKELLFPTGAFTLPRKGKISVGYTSPPLGAADLKVLDSTNTTKPQQNKIKRSINKYFYNNILFKFNEAVVDELFLSGDLEVNQESKNRIPVGNKTLVIEVRGLRPSTDATVIIDILKRRFQDKYKFAAEQVSTQAFYGKTFNTDVGDVVVFGDATLNLPDTKRATRNFAPRLFEVANKTLSIKTGEVRLELIDSGYSLNVGRYGIISPSSKTVAAGSSGDQIKVKNSFGIVAPQLEKTKWTPYIGQKVIVHDDTYDNIHETIFLGFSASDNFLMLLDTPCPFSIGDDFIVEIAPYPDNDNPEDHQLPKRVFVFTNPTVPVVTSVDQFSFDVDPGDVSKFVEGATLLVRDTEWDVYSPEVRIESIVGTTITVNNDLGFIPLAGYEVDLIGFKDAGSPYRYL